MRAGASAGCDIGYPAKHSPGLRQRARPEVAGPMTGYAKPGTASG
jgi:hypothetical protein